MKITALEPQQTPGRYNLFVDGKFRLGLTEAVVARYGLRPGISVDEELLAEIEAAEKVEGHWEAALRLLARRPYSTHELAARLARRGAGEDEIAAVVARLGEYGYLDDGAFARQWIRERWRFRPSGRRLLEAELAQKGIPPEIRRQALTELYEEETELNQCRQAAEKAFRRYKGRPAEEARRKVFAHLTRRGFGFEEIRRVLAELLGPEPF